jgi:hypothetical protein
MAELQTTEPTEIRAGANILWERQDLTDDYAASDDWTLKYFLFHPTNAKITITASANGDYFSVSKDSTVTKDYSAGTYNWVAIVSKGDDKHEIDEGSIKIQPDLETASTYDTRSHAKKMLDAIEVILEGDATDGDIHLISTDQSGRGWQKDSNILYKLRRKYRSEYSRELNKKRRAKGLSTCKRHVTTFT